MSRLQQTIEVIDSHTGGEPTRVVVSGAPTLASQDMAAAAREFATDFDDFRRTVINEPRGHDVLVGALLLPAQDPGNTIGVIFFNNVGCIGMCGHGTIGVAVTLLREGRIGTGEHRIETPAGVVTITVHDEHRVSVQNVASYRLQKQAEIDVDGIGRVRGDIAWGGNWFFLVDDHRLDISLDNIEALQRYAGRVRRALDASKLRGSNGALIDHVELFATAPDSTIADSRNFVLCPGGAFDRSPCGTGTSAKLACLLADGKLNAGDVWRQQGVTGSVFAAEVRLLDGALTPVITGDAYITGRTTLIVEAGDPYAAGLARRP